MRTVVRVKICDVELGRPFVVVSTSILLHRCSRSQSYPSSSFAKDVLVNRRPTSVIHDWQTAAVATLYSNSVDSNQSWLSPDCMSFSALPKSSASVSAAAYLYHIPLDMPAWSFSVSHIIHTMFTKNIPRFFFYNSEKITNWTTISANIAEKMTTVYVHNNMSICWIFFVNNNLSNANWTSVRALWQQWDLPSKISTSLNSSVDRRTFSCRLHVAHTTTNIDKDLAIILLTLSL